jgi:poly(A) polymerase/tRNA nucleotidyltransferase (CCA-adding enzyme)
MKFAIPKEIKDIGSALGKAGHEAHLVGGCVRDLVLSVEPKDWDIATNAKPEEVQKVFPDSVYENNFGTVGVKTDSEDLKLKIVEITTFRLEGKYSDKRHPDEIKFAKTIGEDLSRRDFTINALALNLEGEEEIIDPYGGKEDLKNKVLKTVGDPEARFTEDALRLMRAVRFATEFDLQIEFETRRAILKHAGLLEAIAKERIRDELIKILMTPRAAQGIILLEELDLLRYVLPELREGLGVGQNKHHIYTVFEHNVRALDYSARKNYSLLVRMSSLLHDVGKPRVKAGDGPDSTFYAHEIVGAKMTLKILDNLHFPKDFIEKTAHLVRHHLFYYNVDEVTPAGVRRFLTRVGPENIDDLFKVREADRIGSGVPKAFPYKLRHLQFMIEKVKNDPLSPKMLKVSGEDVMEIAQIQPGPKVGWILNILLEEVIEEPKLNEREMLEKRIHELTEFKDSELKKLSEKAKETKDEAQSGVEEGMKKKYYVK